MMENIPRHREQYRFDAFCKSVLRNEAVDYLRSLKRQSEREVSFSDLLPSELEKFCTAEHYPGESHTFSSHGCELQINNDQVAEVFAELSETEQSILILRFVLEMTDKEIGLVLGMSRCAVQRRRTKALEKMRDRLRVLLPKGE